MSTSLTISVLCPSGHTVTVKSLTPNDPLLKILESACQKRKLDPVQHRLQRQNRPLDASLTIRFANLPNRCSLEMVRVDEGDADAKKKNVEDQAQTVSLCVQLESGKRIQSDFPSSQSLNDILQQLAKDQASADWPSPADDEEPVVVYMRQELIGWDALKETSLRKLGLTGGRALVRLLFRRRDAMREQAHSGEVRLPKAASRPESPPRRAMRLPEDAPRLPEDAPRLPEPPKAEAGQSGAPAARDRPGDILDAARKEVAKTKMAAQLEKEEEAGTPMEEDEEEAAPPPPQLTQPKDEEVAEEPAPPAEPPVLHYLEPEDANNVHHVVAFHLGSGSSASFHAFQPDDSFFDLSVNEVARRQKELQRESRDLQDGAPLATAAYKQTRQLVSQARTLDAYVRTVVRVQFPDRHVWQAAFLSGQTVADVKALLRRYLSDGDGAASFDLFVAPPKRILLEEQTLLEAGCVPSALVHFSAGDKECRLKARVLEKLSNLPGAAQAAREANVARRQQRQKQRTEEEAMEEEDQATSPADGEGAGSKKPKQQMRAGPSTAGAVPKWFQQGMQ